jgi:hypothetical protein
MACLDAHLYEIEYKATGSGFLIFEWTFFLYLFPFVLLSLLTANINFKFKHLGFYNLLLTTCLFLKIPHSSINRCFT